MSVKIVKSDSGCLVIICREEERDKAIEPYITECKSKGMRVMVLTEDAPDGKKGMILVSCAPFLFDGPKQASVEDVMYVDNRKDSATTGNFRTMEFEKTISFGSQMPSKIKPPKIPAKEKIVPDQFLKFLGSDEQKKAISAFKIINDSTDDIAKKQARIYLQSIGFNF